MALEIRQFPCLTDNYGFLIRCSETGDCAAVDTPEPARILEEARAAGWRVMQIWNTHHHWDHAGGNDTVRAATGARIAAPASEADKIGHVDRPVRPGERVRLGSLEAEVMDVGGHTLGHVAYWFESEKTVFAGDALFALGCGRMFEGTAPQMQAGLARLRALPDDTVVYCAHEYTAANARFALSADPDNRDLQAYAGQVDEKRRRGEPTVPSTIAREKAANPFLRWDDPGLRARLGMEEAEDWAVFAELRARKDAF